MDMEKLAKRLSRVENRNRKNVWFKPGQEKETVRILPNPHDPDGIPYMEVNFHYNIGGIVSVVCPRETFGDRCPICELAETFRAMGTDQSFEIFRKIQAKLRTYSPVIVRGKEAEGVKLWGYGTTIYTELMKASLDPDWGDVSDIKEGFDLVVNQIPANGPGNPTLYPKPEMSIKRNSSPLMPTTKEIKALLKSIPNYMEEEGIFNIMDENALLGLVEGLSMEEDDEIETETSFVNNNTVDADGDDSDVDEMEDKLSNLLKGFDG